LLGLEWNSEKHRYIKETKWLTYQTQH
jgi:hypothetical protein